ncbi:putative conserved coiled coil protein [Thioalkalivibrio nitratireducens DSM 14787]|uniref:Conserved coiled coil protein n=1 Tax=Thioalkalivibrio nitratireducens (strain DSM 14787 / UNIQEM 213 / ALEN2) TaxID=1255043 RepID=L0DTB3_THIND|nr:hypothetical protein [Thioalkalivibrio nitratireducens]AGA32844.1 putative conserved coiled coil protein [Thioalkalivibrio nitratireducens DSM 14787]
MSDRDAYLEKMKARIDEWNAEVARLEAKAREAEADMRLKYDAQLKEMREQRDALEERLRDMQRAGEESWRRVRDGMEAAWDEMTRAFREAADRFR